MIPAWVVRALADPEADLEELPAGWRGSARVHLEEARPYVEQIVATMLARVAGVKELEQERGRFVVHVSAEAARVLEIPRTLDLGPVNPPTVQRVQTTETGSVGRGGGA